jgi:hypothetical protein
MENPQTDQIISDIRQSDNYGKFIEKIGWKTIKAGNVQIFIRQLGLFGAIAKIQRVTTPLPWEKINPELMKYRVRMCKCEPLNMDCREELKRQRFNRDNWPLIGSKTLRVDIGKREEDVLLTFKKDARYCLRNISRLNIDIKINAVDQFYEIWKRSAKRKNLWIPPKKDFDSLINCFGKDAFSVTINNVCGCLVLLHNKTAYYYYSAALPEAKKLDLPYATVWEGMKEARKRGAKVWDFEGIYDERWPNKGWKGFTHFKKSFGGTEVILPGSFSRWF